MILKTIKFRIINYPLIKIKSLFFNNNFYTSNILADNTLLKNKNNELLVETVDLNYKLFKSQNDKLDFHHNCPIIILHGLFGSHLNYRSISQKIATELNQDVYCLDLRNFGDSPHINKLDYSSMSADVEKFIELNTDLQKNKPLIIGHSMGGKVAMTLSFNKPYLIKSIVCVDIAPLNYFQNNESNFVKYVKSLECSLEDHKNLNIKDVDNFLKKVEDNKNIRLFLLKNIKQDNKGRLYSKIPLKIIENALRSGIIEGWPYNLKDFKLYLGLALFIRGSLSNYIPSTSYSLIYNFFPNSEIIDVKSGHFLIEEQPTLFLDIISKFIKKINV